MDSSSERWFSQNTFHHSRFADIERLVRIKQGKNLKISVALPTLNEESTIGREIQVLKQALMHENPLVDEIAVIDSGSTDRTRELAREAGADVYLSSEILPALGSYTGKGENLWKSLAVLSGDIIAWIDADIKNIHPKFVYGIVGPLLENDRLGYVKAYYERPINIGNKMKSAGGGRVTELMARPLLAGFYPELSLFLQPLSGEYAGRREILESIPFSVGYGVEIGHLIDIYEKHGLSVFAQVDLDKRIHRNQTLPALSKMSFAIFQTVMNKLNHSGRIHLTENMCNELNLLKVKEYIYHLRKEEVRLYLRPPMNTVKPQKKPLPGADLLVVGK